jgi:hypothetical protein
MRVLESHPSSPHDEDLSLGTPKPQTQERGEGGAPWILEPGEGLN